MSASSDGQPAQWWERLAAYIVDTVIYSFGSALVVLPVFFLTDPFGQFDRRERVPYGEFVRHAGPYFAACLFASVAIFVCSVYFDAKGASPGKRVLGIRVADAATLTPIGWRRASVRRFVFFVGSFAFYLGLLWMLFDPQHRTWHDKAAKSLVVASGP